MNKSFKKLHHKTVKTHIVKQFVITDQRGGGGGAEGFTNFSKNIL